MFSFFNRRFSDGKEGLKHQNTIEMRAPNGGIYRFSTNTMDNETFNQFAKRLEEATKKNNQEEFDKVWNELQNESGLSIDFDREFQRLHEQMRAFIEDASSVFGAHRSFLSNFEPRLLLGDSIDDQIKYHEEEMKRLQQLKNNEEEYRKKMKIKEEIQALKRQMDQKLKEYGENLENEQMKKKINDELVEINRKIKQLENEYNSLS